MIRLDCSQESARPNNFVLKNAGGKTLRAQGNSGIVGPFVEGRHSPNGHKLCKEPVGRMGGKIACYILNISVTSF